MNLSSPKPKIYKRKFNRLEMRRHSGVKMIKKGLGLSEIAKQLGVTKQTVDAWKKDYLKNGQNSWKSKPLGRPHVLTLKMCKKFSSMVRRGGYANGMTSDKWTLKALSKLIKLEFQRDLSPTQVMRLLKDLGFTCAKPDADNESLLKRWEKFKWIPTSKWVKNPSKI